MGSCSERDRHSIFSPKATSFFKVICEDPIRMKKLKIPIEFVRNYGDVFVNEVKLLVPNGRIWKVGLTKSDNRIYFDQNWIDFVKYYSIRERYFLTFEVVGFFTFGVHIFAPSACEIQYPSTATTTPIETVASPVNPTQQCEAEHTQNMITQKSERAIDAFRKFKPVNPWFKIIFGKVNRHSAYVPQRFTKEILKKVPTEFKVQVSDGTGRQWNIKVNQRKCERLNFGSGWSEFCKENNLKENDICVFQLMKKNVLKVAIFHDKKQLC